MIDYFSSLPENERPQRKPGDRPPRNEENSESSQKRQMPDNVKRVWLKEGTGLKPVVIETGVSDGIYTQIVSGLKEGDQVVTSMELGNTLNNEEQENEEIQKSPFVQERPGRPGGPR